MEGYIEEYESFDGFSQYMVIQQKNDEFQKENFDESFVYTTDEMEKIEYDIEREQAAQDLNISLADLDLALLYPVDAMEMLCFDGPDIISQSDPVHQHQLKGLLFLYTLTTYFAKYYHVK